MTFNVIWGPGERDIILKVLVLQDLEIPYLFMGHFPCIGNRNSVQNTTARAATVAFPCSEAISSRSLCPRSQNWLRSRKEDKERDFLFGDITLRSWLSALDCTVGQVEQLLATRPPLPSRPHVLLTLTLWQVQLSCGHLTLSLTTALTCF